MLDSCNFFSYYASSVDDVNQCHGFRSGRQTDFALRTGRRYEQIGSTGAPARVCEKMDFILAETGVRGALFSM